MNILIFNGAVRKNGDTAQLIRELTRQLSNHEIHIVDCHDPAISPCVDCRCCWEKPFCAIKDGMQEVYKKINEADWIILAAPVHFDEVSGCLLQTLSRLQLYCMARMMRKEELLQPKVRRGAALLAAGGPGKAEPAHAMMKRLLHCMHATDECIIHCKGTDKIAVLDNEIVLEQIRKLTEQING